MEPNFRPPRPPKFNTTTISSSTLTSLCKSQPQIPAKSSKILLKNRLSHTVLLQIRPNPWMLIRIHTCSNYGKQSIFELMNSRPTKPFFDDGGGTHDRRPPPQDTTHHSASTEHMGLPQFGAEMAVRLETVDTHRNRSNSLSIGIPPRLQSTNCINQHVRWDELASIRRPERVSPWEIEPFVVSLPTSLVQSTTTKHKRFRSHVEISVPENPTSTTSAVWNPSHNSHEANLALQEQRSIHYKNCSNRNVNTSVNVFAEETEKSESTSARRESLNVATCRLFGVNLISPSIGVLDENFTIKPVNIPSDACKEYISSKLSSGDSEQKSCLSQDSEESKQDRSQVLTKDVQKRENQASRNCTKMKYDSMKTRVESVVEQGKVSDEYISNEKQHQVLSRYWTKDFTRQNHPSIIQVLLVADHDKDITGNSMPNLVYVSREKSKATPHYFKAGALNALSIVVHFMLMLGIFLCFIVKLRVSSIMTNAPIVLTLDCDMYSNDPSTLRRVLCYILDESSRPNLGYIQIPQRYHGLNNVDIYASEHKHLFLLNPPGMDGLDGPSYVGTGCFFRRRTFFGGPSLLVEPEIPELRPDYIVKKPIIDQEILNRAHHVAGCNYESLTSWGSKIGFRYGSLVEDYYTGYRLQCEGWKSIFCDPNRPAFLGDVPISLIDVLNQNKRWAIGLLEVGFSKYSPLTFGIQAMGILMGQAYAYYAFWAIWSIPITVYAFLPSLTLLNGISIFPKVSDPWFLAYIFLFLGAYVQECLDFILTKGTFQRWWSDQRIWLIRGLSSYLFGFIEYIAKQLGMDTHGFNVTSKVMDDEQSKRYDEGTFEFGVESPMFMPLAMAAILNLMAFSYGGIVQIFKERNLDGFFVQVFIAGFGVLNCLPIYEAMVLRSDKGRMPTRTTIISTLFVGGLCVVTSFVLNM
ncbi:cellulose synthase G3 [Olea europaea subsp. europaea]|uniref:Cellulose synthase G3 n=1 Tax=Olea europaea subsp. europaea TaxID=158383 RepID=A0A8S0U8I7_OLEEU|nr:cellulose synthase G3 [Olea europaea subsp. europaea]